MSIHTRIRTLMETQPEKLKEAIKTYFTAVAAEIDEEGHVWLEYEGGDEAGWLDEEQIREFLENTEEMHGAFSQWSREYENEIKPQRAEAERLESEGNCPAANDAWDTYDRNYNEHLEKLQALIQGREPELDAVLCEDE